MTDFSKSGHILQSMFSALIFVQNLTVDASKVITSSELPLGIMKIKRAVRDTIDENHPIVLNLVSAGYTVEQSINAVENCGTLEGALDYLGTIDMDEEEGELFPSNYKPQLSNEDSLPYDTFKMKW